MCSLSTASKIAESLCFITSCAVIICVIVAGVLTQQGVF